MGGNKWESLGDSLYQASPVVQVAYSQLDLYLMGLIPAESVAPLQLLTQVRPVEAAALTGRVSSPVTVQADMMDISIDQIIEVEGRRDPEVGFNAKTLRQAWIYVYQSPSSSSQLELSRIQELQDQWGDFFNQATGGLSKMEVDL
jgi:hypothetical protein